MDITNFSKNVNFRDLGGYKAKDGRTVRHGYFYRSGALYLMSEKEREVFRSLNIHAILDLRSKKEWDRNPDPVFPNVERLEYSGKEFNKGAQIDFSPEGMMVTDQKAERQFSMLKEYYSSIPYDNEALTIFFKEVKEHHFPLLFHCFSGKDRTGITAMLILGLLGCDKDTLINDYLLSNEYHKDTIAQKLEEMPDDLKLHPETVQLVQMTWGVNREIGEAVYDGVIQNSHSFEEYFMKEHNYSKKDIEDLKSLLLK